LSYNLSKIPFYGFNIFKVQLLLLYYANKLFILQVQLSKHSVIIWYSVYTALYAVLESLQRLLNSMNIQSRVAEPFQN